MRRMRDYAPSPGEAFPPSPAKAAMDELLQLTPAARGPTARRPPDGKENSAAVRMGLRLGLDFERGVNEGEMTMTKSQSEEQLRALRRLRALEPVAENVRASPLASPSGPPPPSPHARRAAAMAAAELVVENAVRHAVEDVSISSERRRVRPAAIAAAAAAGARAAVGGVRSPAAVSAVARAVQHAVAQGPSTLFLNCRRNHRAGVAGGEAAAATPLKDSTLAECMVCMDDCPRARGLSCSEDEGHFMCGACVEQFVRSELEPPASLTPRCPTCRDQAPAYPDEHVARFVTPATWRLLATLRQAKAREARRVACSGCAVSLTPVKLEGGLCHSCLAASPRRAARHRSRLKIEEMLTESRTARCNQCSKVVVKTHGCNCMLCPDCKVYFCYLCNKDLGKVGQTAHASFPHRHVSEVTKQPNKFECWLFDDHSRKPETAQAVQAHTNIKAYLKSLEKAEREDVIRCSQDLLAQAKLSKKDSALCAIL